MKKLTGLLIFALALGGAIALTKYYSARHAPEAPARPEPPDAPPDAPPPPAPPAEPGAASVNAPVTFKVRAAVLDFATGKSHLTLELERDPARPAPDRLWVWAYFFTNEAGGARGYCSGDPVEVRRPFTAGAPREMVNVTASASSCTPPRTPSTTYYARVNVSAESSFAARLAERQISYDINSATAVVAQGARPARP